MTPLATLARLLPLLPGTDRVKAALLGVQPAALSTWLAEHAGTVDAETVRRRGWRRPTALDVALLRDLIRAHIDDATRALDE